MMKCRNCGKIIPSGTLCEDCYNEHTNFKEKSGKALLKITRKFIPKHEILVNFEWICFAIIVIIWALANQNLITVAMCIVTVLIILLFSLFISKRIAVGTKCYFYENKIVYTFDFMFIHKRKTYSYSEIKDIVYNQKWLQKKFGLGTLTVISKKSRIIFKGFVIEDVADIENVFKELSKIIGNKLV